MIFPFVGRKPDQHPLDFLLWAHDIAVQQNPNRKDCATDCTKRTMERCGKGG
jgi:hypothetical protein